MNHEGNKILRCGVGEEWDAHRREVDITGRKVEKTYSKVNEMAIDIDSTARTLAKASAVLDTIKSDLVGAATGRGQISLWSHMLTVLILGIIALVILVERSQKVIHFGATPLTPEVTISNEETNREAKSDAPKT